MFFLDQTNSRHVQLADHNPEGNRQIVALDRYITCLRHRTECTLLAVVSPRKSFWRHDAVKTFFRVKKKGPRRLPATNPQSQISRFAFPSSHLSRGSPSPPFPFASSSLLHLRKTLAADPSSPRHKRPNRGPNRARAREFLAGPVEISGPPFSGESFSFVFCGDCLISAAHDGEPEGGGEEREDHSRPHEAAAQPQVHQLQQCGKVL